MSTPPIHGNRSIYSASAALRTVGDALGQIRQQDGLTWSEVGRVLGKSDDQAAKYADGSAEMGIVAFGLAKREWNGRFTGPFDRLCVESRPAGICDNTILSTVMHASLEIARAKEVGDEIYPHEIRACRSVLEAARDAIDELLRKGE